MVQTMGELKSTEILKYIDTMDPVIIEIGAYRGDDTCNFVRFFEGKVFVVEPDPRNIPYLKNLQSQHSNLTIFENAVSDKDDQLVEFYMSELRENSDHANFSSSIMKPKLHLVQHPRILFNKKCMVKTITLDTIYKLNNIKTVDFIWADVQGAEHLLIKGGINALKNTKYFYTEYSNEEIFENEQTLETIKNMVPFMSIVEDFDSNVLFKNNLL
jgi:FkbM family methyltransferase